MENPIILALDTSSLDEAVRIARSLRQHVNCFKVGLELLTAEGLAAVCQAFEFEGLPLFVDVKYSDIPNTVSQATQNLTRFSIKFFTVHASSGLESLRAASIKKKQAKLLAVTVLTSIDSSECQNIFGAEASSRVLSLARKALDGGADGVVCSPEELKILATDTSLKSLIRVTPGIRPSWTKADDQKRKMTPAEAISLGANYLVIGRPILRPPQGMSSVESATRILQEIQGVKT